jgi:hypothetical protein
MKFKWMITILAWKTHFIHDSRYPLIAALKALGNLATDSINVALSVLKASLTPQA